MDLLCGLARVYSTMVSAALLKVMNFYDDMGRFKFLLDVFICKSYSRGSFFVHVFVIRVFSLIGVIGKL